PDVPGAGRAAGRPAPARAPAPHRVRVSALYAPQRDGHRRGGCERRGDPGSQHGYLREGAYRFGRGGPDARAGPCCRGVPHGQGPDRRTPAASGPAGGRGGAAHLRRAGQRRVQAASRVRPDAPGPGSRADAACRGRLRGFHETASAAKGRREAAMSTKVIVETTINGVPETFVCEPRQTLLEVLREELGLTGAKEGCGNGNCGACCVLLDGRPVNSCLVLAVEAAGREIVTVEGLAAGGLHPLQQAFLEHGALQCGICTPGFLMSAKALLDANPRPTEQEARRWLAGNLC